MGEAKRRGTFEERQAKAIEKRIAEEKRQSEMDALAEKFAVEVKSVNERYGLELAAMRVQPARFVVTDLDKLLARMTPLPVDVPPAIGAVFDGPGGPGGFREPAAKVSDLPDPSATASAIIARELSDLSAACMDSGFDPLTDGDDCDACEHEHCAGCEPDLNPDTDADEVPHE
jgi:hypothetical protein